jgi:peptide/nickel transport system permease protein
MMEEIKTNNIEARDSTENNRIFLTPGQLVMRRFIRNRAAVIGIVVLVFMVVFCFIGPLFSPYTETELFYMAKEQNTVTAEDGTVIGFIFEIDESLTFTSETEYGRVSNNTPFVETTKGSLLSMEERDLTALTSKDTDAEYYVSMMSGVSGNEQAVAAFYEDGTWIMNVLTDSGFINVSGTWEYHDKEEIRMNDRRIVNAVLNVRAAPSKAHPLGTDQGGRDMLTRLMYGGRVSLLVGLCVVIVELLIGVTLGGIAGYYGGKIDMVIMRLVEIFYAIPFIPLMLIISSIMMQLRISPANKIYYIMFVMGILYWAGVARMIRGQILSLREMEYMQAAEALGLRTSRKIFKHLIPNVMPLIIVMATMDLGSIILTESTMSFLGVGVAAPYASWGNMVSAVTSATVMKNNPWIWIPPGLCILITVLAFNFVGDGLRDAFDPKMKR